MRKIDHNFNANNLLTGRYYFGDSDQSFPFAQLAGGLLPGFNTITPTRVQLVSLSYVKVVNANQVNEARLGWNRFVEGFFPEDQNFDPSSIGLNTGVTSTFDFGLPQISVGGYSPIGASQFGSRSREWIPTGTSSTTIRGSPAVTTSSSDTSSAGRRFQLIQDNTFPRQARFRHMPIRIAEPNTLSPLEAFLEGIPSSGKQTPGQHPAPFL